MDEWAGRWNEVVLRIGPADRERFEAAARDCYRFIGVPFPDVVVWVPSPLVIALAAPAAALAIGLTERPDDDPALSEPLLGGPYATIAAKRAARAVWGQALRDLIGDALQDRLGAAIHHATQHAVYYAICASVRGAITHRADQKIVQQQANEPIDSVMKAALADVATRADFGEGLAVQDVDDHAIINAVKLAVNDVVDESVLEALDLAIRGAATAKDASMIQVALCSVIRNSHPGSSDHPSWVGGVGAEQQELDDPAFTSFFREVCDLKLVGDLWDRARAFQATRESAGWWWAHRRFVMVSERPTEIHLEQLDLEDGPVISWPDGWGISVIDRMQGRFGFLR